MRRLYKHIRNDRQRADADYRTLIEVDVPDHDSADRWWSTCVLDQYRTYRRYGLPARYARQAVIRHLGEPIHAVRTIPGTERTS